MFLLIDADITMFKSVVAAEEEYDWGNDIFTLLADVKVAKDVFKRQIEQYQKDLKIDDFICCLSDHNANFRKEVSETYKSNRKKTRKPVGYRALCDWIEENYETYRQPKLEADDCLGILATKPENVGKCVMVSQDKDLKTIPGRLYRPDNQERLTISEAEADRYFYIQTLTGDTVDGYPGLKGCGPKTAEKILGSRPDWSLVEAAYVKAGLTAADAITQARLARILRWTDWDEEKGEVILWTPKQST